jgi:hypothetical protein
MRKFLNFQCVRQFGLLEKLAISNIPLKNPKKRSSKDRQLGDPQGEKMQLII